VSRLWVGLLAAVVTCASGLAAYLHGDFIWMAVAGASAGSGLGALLAAPQKKLSYARFTPWVSISWRRFIIGVPRVWSITDLSCDGGAFGAA
jgi:predicted acylesterase/phospholipase RssA